MHTFMRTRFLCGSTLVSASFKSISNTRQSLNAHSVFIQKVGQYGQTMKGYESMGVIKYGYEGLAVPILFTAKGLIHLHRKVEKISHDEEKRLEQQGIPEE